MSRLTRDGTAEPVSRDQILRRDHISLFNCRIGNLTRFIHTLLFVMTKHTYTRNTLRMGEVRQCRSKSANKSDIKQHA